jgi:hypothetical protein
MKSPETSSLASALKNLDLTLEVEVPLGPSDSCNSFPSISLGPVKIPLTTSIQEQPISGVFTKDSLIGSLDSQDTTGDQVP